MAKEQLDMTYERKMNEFEEISKLTNPTVRKKLLMEFAEGSDSSAVHLKAASLPESELECDSTCLIDEADRNLCPQL